MRVQPLRTLYEGLSLRQRLTIGAAAVLVITSLLFFLRWNRERNFKPLYTSLSAEDAGPVIAKLRESGVGDMVVGKHMGRLMSTLGGRLGAYRDTLATADDRALSEAIARNVTLVEGIGPERLTGRVRALAGALDAVPADRLLAGDIPA